MCLKEINTKKCFRERERVKRGRIKRWLAYVAVAALFLAACSSVKAQESDNQDGFRQIYQFYKDKIVLPQYFQDNDSNENKLTVPRLHPRPIETESKVFSFSPVFKLTEKIKNGYLSIGEKTLSFSLGLFDRKSDNLSAVATTQNQQSSSSSQGTPTSSVGGMSTSTIQSAEVPDQSEEIMDLLKSQLAALDEQVKKIEKSGLVFSSSLPAVNADKIKKEINAALSASPNGITKEYLEDRLNSINISPLNKITPFSVQASKQNSPAFQSIRVPV